MEHLSLGAVRARATEIRLRKICRTRSQDDGTAIRRPEAQSTPNVDRRRGSSGEVVLRVEASYVGYKKKWRRVSASDDGAGDATVEKLSPHRADTLIRCL